MQKSLVCASCFFLVAACSAGEPSQDAGTHTPPGGDAAVPDAGVSDPEDAPPEPVPPTTRQLIGAALADGTLDEATAGYYWLLAENAPGYLPDELQSEQPELGAPSSVAQLLVRTHWSSYDDATKQAIEAMLVRPDHPKWNQFPMEISHNLAAGEEKKGPCLAQYDEAVVGDAVNTTYYSFVPYYAADPDLALPRSAELRSRIETALAAMVPNVAGKAPAQVTLAQYFDNAFEYMINDLGLKDFRSVFMPQEGNRIYVWVMTCDGELNTAGAKANWEANTTDPDPAEIDAYLKVSVGLALEDEDFRRVAIPHETMHLIEYGYRLNPVSKHWAWPYEASAVYVEDRIAPDVRRWAGHHQASDTLPGWATSPLDRSFRCPEEPLHTSFEGGCLFKGAADRGANNKYDGDYSKFFLLDFLERNSFLSIKQFWESYAANGDPRPLVTDALAAEFQLALLADQQGQTPFFDPDDRGEFFVESWGKKNLDQNVVKRDRYTHKVLLTKWNASPTHRLTPADPCCESGASDKLDGSLRIDVGGTHRFLIQVPPEAAVGEVNDWLWMHVRAKGEAPEVVLKVGRLLMDGSDATREVAFDGRLFKEFAPGPLDRMVRWSAADGPLPRYLVGVVHNAGDAPVSYEVALHQPARCMQSCMEEVGAELVAAGCPEFWCGDDGGDCVRTYTDDMGFILDGGLVPFNIGYCDYVCKNTLGNLENPYVPGDEDDAWRTRVCEASSMSREECDAAPAGMVPLTRWPIPACDEIMSGG